MKSVDPGITGFADGHRVHCIYYAQRYTLKRQLNAQTEKHRKGTCSEDANLALFFWKQVWEEVWRERKH